MLPFDFPIGAVLIIGGIAMLVLLVLFTPPTLGDWWRRHSKGRPGS